VATRKSPHPDLPTRRRLPTPLDFMEHLARKGDPAAIPYIPYLVTRLRRLKPLVERGAKFGGKKAPWHETLRPHLLADPEGAPTAGANRRAGDQDHVPDLRHQAGLSATRCRSDPSAPAVTRGASLAIDTDPSRPADRALRR
jgi:hypothetical protein